MTQCVRSPQNTPMNILKFSLDVEAIFSLTTLAVMPRLVCFWHEWIAKGLTLRNSIQCKRQFNKLFGCRSSTADGGLFPRRGGVFVITSFGQTKRITERILRSKVQRVSYALTLVMSSCALVGCMNKNRLIVHKFNLGKPQNSRHPGCAENVTVTSASHWLFAWINTYLLIAIIAQ